MAKKSILKYVIIILLVLFALVGIIGRILMEQSKNSLEYIIAQASQKTCPITIGGNCGEITKITYDGSNVVYHICYRDEYADLNVLRENASNYDDVFGISINMINGINNIGSEQLFHFLEEHGLGIKYMIRNDSGDTCSIITSFEEIKRAYDSYDGTSPTNALQQAIQMNLDMYNHELPMQIDAGMWLNSFSYEADTIFMNIQLDGNEYDVSAMDFTGISIFDMEISEDEMPLYQALFGLCKTANSHFVIRYYDKDTNEEALLITNKEKINRFNTNRYID